MHFSRLGISSDHAGKELKKMVSEYLKVLGVEVIDYGIGYDVDKSVDYPDYAEAIAKDVSSGSIQAGICICGTGIGMSIAANKWPQVRAAVVWDEYSCVKSRQHNNANIMCIGSRTLNPHRAVDLVKLWVETAFEGDRHQLRLDKISETEKSNFKTK